MATRTKMTARSPDLEGDGQFWAVDQRGSGTLAAGLLADGQNLRMPNGRPETRKGVAKPAWGNKLTAGSDVVGPWGTPYGCGVFRHPDSRVDWELIAADGYVWRTRPYNQGGSVSLPTGVRVLGRVQFCQAFNKVYLARGRYFAPLVMSDLDTGFVDLVARWAAGGTYKAEVIVLGQDAEEVAYGPYQGLASLTRTGETATAVTTSPHGLVTGADVYVTGAVQGAYNGRVPITVVDGVTFTYPVAGSPATPATGTVKVSNMAQYWKALGSQITLGVGELTSAATTATVHHVAHGFSNGQYVTVTGAVQTEYNVTQAAVTVTDADHFTFPFVGSGTTPATGTIKVRTSIVLAGQSPDTNAEAWQRIYDVLPNCERFIYINNQLLGVTAFEPSSADSYATFNGGDYKKTDYVVVTNYLDEVHFDFADAFRINQGSADEIVDVAKYNENTAIIWKGSSWGVLSNVQLDLATVRWDTRSTEYGLAAVGAWCGAGTDLLFIAEKRGVVSIQLTDNGKLQGVDLPLSAPLQPTVDRIDWLKKDGFRMANWGNFIYAAVRLLPGENGIATTMLGLNVVPSGSVYAGLPGPNAAYTVTGLVVGKRYLLTLGNASQVTDSAKVVAGAVFPDGTAYAAGEFVATQSSYNIWGPEGEVVTTMVQPALSGNNALLVYDTVAASVTGVPGEGWAGVDTGSALSVVEFAKLRVDGVERLLFLDEQGYGNVMEEMFADQIAGVSGTGLQFEEIVTRAKSRVYDEVKPEEARAGTDGGAYQKMPLMMVARLETWNPMYSLTLVYDGAFRKNLRVVDETRDRTVYRRPFDAAAWDESNVNDDWGTEEREDYSVLLPVGGINLGSGVGLMQMQESLHGVTVRGRQAARFQVELSNRQGRVRLMRFGFEAVEGRKRPGII